MEPTKRIVILGGGYAGLFAAARLAGEAKHASITLIDGRSEFTQRIRLHELLAGSLPRSAGYREILEPKGIGFHQARVENIDVAARRVWTVDGTGIRHELDYDLLIVALGSTTGAPLPGIAEFATRLNDPAEIKAAATRIASIAGRHGSVLVAGGGMTGIETAAELAERYPALKLTLLTRDSLDQGYSTRGGEHLRSSLRQLGVEIIEKSELTHLEQGQAFTSTGTVRFDLAIWTGGFVPPAIGRLAGLPVDAAGGILVDERLQVPGHPEILVAGDCASAHASWGNLRMGCVTASPMGAHAGDNARRLLCGEPLKPFDMAFPGRNISLGRSNALVQITDYRDQPVDTIFTGRIAAFVKELVCKATFTVPQWELKSGLRMLDISKRKVPAEAGRTRSNSGDLEWSSTAEAR